MSIFTYLFIYLFIYLLNFNYTDDQNKNNKLNIFTSIIYMKKLLNSDWLRAVQKSVTVQITHRNSGLRLAERQ